jgi:hypothetical protein
VDRHAFDGKDEEIGTGYEGYCLAGGMFLGVVGVDAGVNEIDVVRPTLARLPCLDRKEEESFAWNEVICRGVVGGVCGSSVRKPAKIR